MKTIAFPARISCLSALAFFLWLLISVPVFGADEVFPSLEIGTNKLTNVSVLLATPEDLLLKHDTGHLRVKLQDLPAPLKKLYPYDAKKAAAYEETNSTSKRLDAVALRERQLRASISQVAAQEEAVREKRRILRGKNGSPDRGKMKNLEEDITKFRKQQEALQVELNQTSALRASLQQELAAAATPAPTKKKKKK
jgi:chromosome segregation ATPase